MESGLYDPGKDTAQVDRIQDEMQIEDWRDREVLGKAQTTFRMGPGKLRI